MLSKSDRDWIDGFFVGYEAASIRNDQPLHKIDEESKYFIKWTLDMLSNPRFFIALSGIIEKQLFSFLQGNHSTLIKKLKRKLRKGALEHGAPSYSLRKAKKELEQEFLDLIGWNMILLWNKRKEKSEAI